MISKSLDESVPSSTITYREDDTEIENKEIRTGPEISVKGQNESGIDNCISVFREYRASRGQYNVNTRREQATASATLC